MKEALNQGYRSLIVWQKAYLFTLEIYRITKKFPKEELYGLTSQLRRAASSVPVNIAEGYGRSSTKEYLQFLSIARGSIFEVETLLLIVRDLGYMDQQEFGKLEQNQKEIARMLHGLKKSLNS